MFIQSNDEITPKWNIVQWQGRRIPKLIPLCTFDNPIFFSIQQLTLPCSEKNASRLLWGKKQEKSIALLATSFGFDFCKTYQGILQISFLQNPLHTCFANPTISQNPRTTLNQPEKIRDEVVTHNGWAAAPQGWRCKRMDRPQVKEDRSNWYQNMGCNPKNIIMKHVDTHTTNSLNYHTFSHVETDQGTPHFDLPRWVSVVPLENPNLSEESQVKRQL